MFAIDNFNIDVACDKPFAEIREALLDEAFHEVAPCPDDFTLAYIECALWSSHDESTPDGGEPMDANYDIDDLAPETLRKMIDDCRDFQRGEAELLAQYAEVMQSEEWNADERAGHDFWLTRNGHGAGFWDRGLGQVGDMLSKACKPYGSCDLYVGDDGKIYC
jgi:hypothetical protein